MSGKLNAGQLGIIQAAKEKGIHANGRSIEDTAIAPETVLTNIVEKWGEMLPDGFNEVEFRTIVLEHYNLSLGAGLGKVAGRVFRIGHLGDLNDLMLCGTLCGVEMGLTRFGVPHESRGVSAAMAFLGGGKAPTPPSSSHEHRKAEGKSGKPEIAGLFETDPWEVKHGKRIETE